MSDTQQTAQECPVRKALTEVRAGMSATCTQEGCTCGDGWQHDSPEVIASVDAALSLPCPTSGGECGKCAESGQRAEDEKGIRIKYQDIVYAVDNVLDAALGRRITNSLPLAVTETAEAVKSIVAERDQLRGELAAEHERANRLESQRDKLHSDSDLARRVIEKQAAELAASKAREQAAQRAAKELVDCLRDAKGANVVLAYDMSRSQELRDGYMQIQERAAALLAQHGGEVKE